MLKFYQVAIWLEGDKKREPSITLTDLGANDLRRKIVKPYTSGEKIAEGGKVFDLSKTLEVKILETRLLASDLVKAANDKINKKIDESNASSRSVVLISFGNAKPWEVEGVDVTDKFIKGPPGHIGVIRKIFRSPLTVMILGLAGAALLGYLGLS